MQEFSFIFTVLFSLIGPIRIVLPYAKLMQEHDAAFKRQVAIRAAIIASAVTAFVAIAGDTMLNNYHISFDALRISGSLVLLISALEAIFHKEAPLKFDSQTTNPIALAASPIATPIIISPMSIAAILIFIMIAPKIPGAIIAIALCLIIMMVLDFLAMFFIDRVMKIPGLVIILTVAGSIVIFVQLCLASELMINAFKSLGIIKT